jgi:hypothetical protein
MGESFSMTTFKATVLVERGVPATKEETNEIARILERYLTGFTYRAEVLKVKIFKQQEISLREMRQENLAGICPICGRSRVSCAKRHAKKKGKR